MDDDIVTGVAGQQLGIDNFTGIVNVVVDPDAVFAFELLDQLRVDIIRPVVDIQQGLVGGKCDPTARQPDVSNRPMVKSMAQRSPRRCPAASTLHAVRPRLPGRWR